MNLISEEHYALSNLNKIDSFYTLRCQNRCTAVPATSQQTATRGICSTEEYIFFFSCHQLDSMFGDQKCPVESFDQ